MQLTQYQGKQFKDPVIRKQEYGTIVQKVKKKKNKKKDRNRDGKQIDEQKIKQAAKQSALHKCQQLSNEQKARYAQAQNHPLMYVCKNLPLKITAEQILTYFNTLVSASNAQLAVPPPIKDVSFDKARTFALMTLSSRKIKDFFRSHTDFQFSQGSTTFKVVKAKNFLEERYLNKKETLKGAGSQNKIYLGGLPISLTDDQVRRICETFGKLSFFNLVKDGAISKGYCFFEFQDGKNQQRAIKALNGLTIVDKKLKCHHATIGNKGLSLAFTPNVQNNIGLQQVNTKASNYSFGSFLLSYENIADLDIQQTLRYDPSCRTPSRVVQFLNMFYLEDLYDQQFFGDLQQDIRDECVKFGPVQRVQIPRPDPNCGYSVPSVGKVLVKFMYIIHAKRARIGLAGRVYNKRTVVTSFYQQQKFNSKDYLIRI